MELTEQQKKENMGLIRCPGCAFMVDEAFYLAHITSEHKLHVINIRGIGPELVPKGGLPGPKMLDIPYFGRVRRDSFLGWTLLMLLVGALFGLRII